ncbi:hypothetical protein [Sphingobium sp. KCTC 72723]|uniref:hypothetical protein n=1 Tax=Sphingobium sp. KCTC 72723 TaxID=2733867 RepID=UPI00165D6885|nr:hypothetical protein [Sphingobium sp. KCTC 72723]
MTIYDRFGRTITEIEPDVWESEGIRLKAPGKSHAVIIAIFEGMLTPLEQPDEE